MRYAAQSENELNQKHVADGPARNGEEHLALPEVKNDNQKDGQKLRNAVTSGKEIHIPQAVNDQQTEYGGGKHFSQILNIFGRGLPGGKDGKRLYIM